MNGWYDRINNVIPVQQAPARPAGLNASFNNNPMARMGQVMQAMRNPAAFVRQHLNIPEQIANNPDAILQYMQTNMGVTQQDIQNAASQIPRF